LSTNKSIFLILENIRSLYNIGAIFRTAEACGVAKIFLVGPTGIIIPTNFHDKRKAVLNPKLTKTALGTERQVSWQHFWTTQEAIKTLPVGTQVIALEQTKTAIQFNHYRYRLPLALIIGNEVKGVSQTTLTLCDAVVQIPMLGKHNSLNVSITAAVCLYQILVKFKII
jgi:23S rRNA (guanosine2251-2'-O)-methyltransferase